MGPPRTLPDNLGLNYGNAKYNNGNIFYLNICCLFSNWLCDKKKLEYVYIYIYNITFHNFLITKITLVLPFSPEMNTINLTTDFL